MSDPLWVGVDLGTQSVRVSVISTAGELLASSSAALTSHRSVERHEQDPEQWWTATRKCLATATSQLAHPEAIAAIAVSATSGTVCLVDAEGLPVGTGIMYDDARGAPFVDLINDVGESVWSRLGFRMQRSWALPAVLWLRDQGELGRSRYIAHQPDIITARLAGRRLSSDSSHALKTGVDLDTLAWPRDVMELLGVPEDVLPDVQESGSVLGTISAQAARETGLPLGCAIVAGMTDGCAAQLAAGVITPGSWNSVLGTTLVVKGSSLTRRADPTGALYAHRAPFGLGWFPGGASSVGAGAISHWLPNRNLAAVTRAARLVGTVAPSYPLLGSGERFPFVSAGATAFFGSDDHPPSSDGEALAAIASGVAFIERLSYDLLATCGYDLSGPVSFTGGGTANDWWNQLRCDVLGRPVTIRRKNEGSIGMAMLASAALAGDSAAQRTEFSASAARFLGPATTLSPAAESIHEAGYRDFVGALDSRGWLDQALVAFALGRAES